MRRSSGRAVCVVLAICVALLSGGGVDAFDFDVDNAARVAIIPALAPPLRAVSPQLSDPSLITWYTQSISSGFFDCIAAYHPTAVGIWTTIERRPAEERTNRNRNICMFYAAYRQALAFWPWATAGHQKMLTDVGLDPSDTYSTPDTAIGIGNFVGQTIAEARMKDEMNARGTQSGCKYNCQPFADWTGFVPSNTAYDLEFPSSWQPNLGSNGLGTFTVQSPVTPQAGRLAAFSFESVESFKVPVPTASKAGTPAYKAQARQVIAASARLTDELKMEAELFNHKLQSLFASFEFKATVEGFDFDIEAHIINNAIVQLAIFEAMVATWANKYDYNAVRPFSAIHYLFKDTDIQAWGGPGKGTVTMKGQEWTSYIPTGNHPEYPSGTSALCAAHVAASRKIFGSDDLNFSVLRAAGSSWIEPGVTPAQDLTLTFPTWTDFSKRCGQSRVNAGVHFPAAVRNAKPLGTAIGLSAYRFIMAKVDGVVDPPKTQ